MPNGKQIVGLAWLALVAGCASPSVTAPDDSQTGLRISSAISQITQPTIALGELAEASVNTTLHVEGEVMQQAPLLESSLYKISDGTHEVWIASQKAPPVVGESIRVRGVLQYESIPINGDDAGEFYLREKSRSVLNKSAEKSE